MVNDHILSSFCIICCSSFFPPRNKAKTNLCRCQWAEFFLICLFVSEYNRNNRNRRLEAQFLIEIIVSKDFRRHTKSSTFGFRAAHEPIKFLSQESMQNFSASLQLYSFPMRNSDILGWEESSISIVLTHKRYFKRSRKKRHPNKSVQQRNP